MSDILPGSQEITRERAIQLHNEAVRQNDLLVWTIYDSPPDLFAEVK